MKIECINVLSCEKTHIPISGYFSGVYMTFLSIIQGVILGMLLQVIYEKYVYNGNILYFISESNFDRYIIIIVSSLVVWHKYINHHQFLAWHITWLDSFWLLIIGIDQAALVFFVDHKDAFYIPQMMLPLLGLLAFNHSAKQHQNKYVKKMFFSHYCMRRFCSEAMYNAVLNYEKKSVIELVVMSVAIFVLSLIAMIYNERSVALFISVIIIIYLIIYLFKTDLTIYLNKNILLLCSKGYSVMNNEGTSEYLECIDEK